MRFETEWAGAAIHSTGGRDGSFSAALSGRSPFAVDRDPDRAEVGCVAQFGEQAEHVRPPDKSHGKGAWITRLLSSAFSNIIEGFALYGSAMYPATFLQADDRPHSGFGEVRRDGRERSRPSSTKRWKI
jgi:hypothetical protein